MNVGRWKWRLGALAILALLLAVALHLYLNSAQVQGWVLSRLKKDLVTQFGDVELGDRFSVDWIGRVTAGPLTVRGEEGTPFAVTSVTVRLAYRPLLKGRVVPAAMSLDRVDVDLDYAKEALKLLLEKRRGMSHELAQSTQHTPLNMTIWAKEIHFRTTRARLQKFLHAFEPLSGRLALQRSAADWRIKGNLRFSEGGHSGSDDLPFTVKDGELVVDLSVDADQNFRRGTASCVAKMQRVSLGGERLDSKTIGPLDLSGEATVIWEGATAQIQLAKTEVGISRYGPLPLEITGRLDLGREPNIDIKTTIHKLDFPRLLDVLPPQLSLGSEVPAMTGVISGQFGLKGPPLQPAKLELTAKLDLTGLHPLQSSSPGLTKSFEYRPAEHRQDLPIVVGEKNPNFVPLSGIPPVLISAVTLSEDASFWEHRGFDFQEIKESLVDAAEERRFRGASTITQQLAKNLYLSREKTYARKIREAFATLALEASLPKSRILEIYLNIIEWGPGIYGIAKAAEHYFGCEVRELTPKQAAFLATIIPNPIKYYVYYRQGALSEVWEKRVHELLVKMRDRGVLNDEQFARAEETPIAFASLKESNGN